MMATTNSQNFWVETMWKNVTILCQKDTQPRFGDHGIFFNPFYIIDSTSRLCLLQYVLILLVVTFTSSFLKPLGLPILSQMAGGVIIMGLLFPNAGPHVLLPDPILYILKSFSYIGFALHSFILGVETNIMPVVRRIGKKSIIICFSGVICSIILSTLTYILLQRYTPDHLQPGSIYLMFIPSQNFFGVICTNVNNLGISNSDLGQLATAIALIIDVLAMLLTAILQNFLIAIIERDYWQPIFVTGQYFFLFFFLRPILNKIISYTPHGERMNQNNFIAIIVVLLLATLAGALVNLHFSVYLFALSIPQEPLSTILAEKLDTITSGFMFPIFCAIHGFEANFGYLKDFRSTIAMELLLSSGHLGKFLGTLFSSKLFAIPWRSAISLAIIMTSKGFFDIILVRQMMVEKKMLSVHEYTLTCLHILITTFTFLPLVRKLYEPSKQYSTVLRQNLMTSFDGGNLQTLFCIFHEENVPGFLHFLEALQPSRSNPIPVVTLQLTQLTGRCSLPIMSTWDRVKSNTAFRSHVDQCNRVVNAFSNLNRKFKGYIRLQHYVSIASNATMHNDICNLAHDKNVSMIVLPFHVEWMIEGGIKSFSHSIRQVNKLVFEKAPCSVAIFIDRGDIDLIQLQLHVPNRDKYRVTIFYLGGLDDQEALALCNFFMNHPFITLTLLWLKSSDDDKENNYKDDQIIEKYLMENERKINYQEVVCKDGSETTRVLKTLKDEVDLAVVGKHHDTTSGPLYGLGGEWSDYPELGVLADLLLTSHFNFSILVVQQEPQHDSHVFDVVLG